MSNVREIILDTETTGLNPKNGHRIVEIGALEMVNKILTGNKFHFYINPERNMPEEAYRIHGISEEFLKNKPLFNTIAENFLEFIRGGILVIHNAQFDIKFLNHELSIIKLPSLELAGVVDTLLIAKKAFPGAKVNLDALCKRFNIDNSFRQFHNALKDASLLAKAYVELTGGKQISFEMKNKKTTKQLKKEERGDAVMENTTIIYPTVEEIKKHKNFLEKISNL